MTTPNTTYAEGAGNSTLTNQDEQDMLSDCIEGIPVQVVGFQADDSHINPQFREQDI